MLRKLVLDAVLLRTEVSTLGAVVLEITKSGSFMKSLSRRGVIRLEFGETLS